MANYELPVFRENGLCQTNDLDFIFQFFFNKFSFKMSVKIYA